MGIRKIPILFIRKKVHLYTDHQTPKSLIKGNRSQKQYSARLTKWLERLTHFDLAIQHIAGSNLKFTVYLSRNPLGGAMPEENYDQEFLLNTLAEQADLNMKFRQILAEQSKCSKITIERKKNDSENKLQHKTNHSQTNRTFDNENHVNETEQNKRTTSGQSDNSTLKNSIQRKHEENAKMDSENFYHWGPPERSWMTLEEKTLAPKQGDWCNNGTRYPGREHWDAGKTTNHNEQSLHHPDTTNAVIVEIDAELIRRANRIGSGYQLIESEDEQEEPEGIREEGEIGQAAETGEDQWNHAGRQFTDRGSDKIQHWR